MQSPLNKVEYLSRTSCPLHSAPGKSTLAKLQYIETVSDSVTGRDFSILLCPACGTGLTNPYPSEQTLKYLYEGRGSVKNFDPIRGTIMDTIKDCFARRDIRHIHGISGHPKIDSVLDYGAGYGRFSFASKRVFPHAKVDAVDFDLEPPPTFQNCNPGVRYVPMNMFLNSSEQYDLIILRGVIEHVNEPSLLLSALKQRMTEKGILYIEAPNINSAYIHYFGKSLNAYAVPYHIFNFSLPSLEAVIQDSGLKCNSFYKGLPLAGCVLAGMLKQERMLIHQFAGIALHPVQLLMEHIRGRYIIASVCTKA